MTCCTVSSMRDKSSRHDGAVAGVILPIVRRLMGSAIVLSVACGGSPTEPSWDGRTQVNGIVLDSRTDAAVAQAHVAIGSAAAMTDSKGFYALSVAAGDQSVVIDDERIGTITLNSRAYRGDFYIHNAGCVARYGTVLDKNTQRPVVGATVSSVYAQTAVATDYNGWFRLSLGCSGDACVGFNTTFLYVTHPNYLDGSFVAGRGVCFVERVDYQLQHR